MPPYELEVRGSFGANPIGHHYSDALYTIFSERR